MDNYELAEATDSLRGASGGASFPDDNSMTPFVKKNMGYNVSWGGSAV